MRSRTLFVAALAAGLGILAVALNADAAWKGLTNFDCESSRSNWNFDGLMGNYTTRAMRRFQQAKGIKVDGIVGPETSNALGMKYRRTVRCGMGGNDVFLLQQALAANGFWYGGVGDSVTYASPKPTVRPKPTPAWTEPPILYTPAPFSSTAPTPMPLSTPAEEEVTNRPIVELRGGDWMVPKNAGRGAYDYTFQKPVWMGGATLWLGDIGLSGDGSLFNTTFVDYRDPAKSYFPQNTAMFDALAKYRFDRGFYNVFAGYRGIGAPNVHFGTAGIGMERPLIGGWLWLTARAQGGHDFRSSYFADGRAGLGLRLWELQIDGGFRHFAYQNAADPMFHINGPILEAKLAF
jgi:peptidoglycan hydrolase-like protein with peptidoglycan-binding domain